jgi:hypothetical protein
MLSVALSNVVKLSVALLHVVMPNVVVPFLSVFLKTFCCFTTAEKKFKVWRQKIISFKLLAGKYFYFFVSQVISFFFFFFFEGLLNNLF